MIFRSNCTNLAFIILCCFLLPFCKADKKERVGEAYPAGLFVAQESPGLSSTDNAFRLIGELHFKKPFYHKKTLVGGLSGIDMNPDGLFYLISDDISEHDPSRFYTAKLDYNEKTFNSIRFIDVTYMKTPSDKFFPHKNDLISGDEKEIANAESIRYHKETNSLFWTSEGLYDPFAPVQPFIRQMNLAGEFINEIATPEQFRFVGNNDKIGLRSNASFESLCLVPGSDELLTVTEAPLIQDGLRANYFINGSPVRITRINWKTGEHLAQYAYVPDKTPVPPLPADAKSYNGVAEILDIDSCRYLVLERSYSEGYDVAEGNSIRVYMIDLSTAPTIDFNSSLAITPFTPISKKLVLDFSKIGLNKIDNLEGMCWGKELPNGIKSIVFISDNNFNFKQIFQVLVFEVDPDNL
jgi:hypothetical protein